MNVKPEDVSILHWVLSNKMVNEKGELLEFRDHGFLIDILEDLSQTQVIKKCAQIGCSVIYTLKAYYASDKGRFNVIYCVDEQTEILSKRGWLKYKDLTLNDKILTLSKDDGKSRFTKVEEIFQKEVKMDLVSFEGRNFSALTTPNHRWIVRKGYGKDESLFFDITENIHKKYYFIPKRADKVIDLPKKSVYSDELVALLGWIFTEGYYEIIKGQNSYRIVITQSYKVNYDKVLNIRKILRSLGVNWKEHKSINGCINFYLKGNLVKKIKSDFSNKLPTIEFINQLTKEQILLLIDTIVAGDGWIDQWGTKNIIQKDKGFIDVISYAAVLVGYVPRVNQRKEKDKCWYLKLTCFDYIWTSGLKPKKVNYKGIIWCPRTKYGTFYARRNGYCYWTGNTMPSDMDVSEFVKTKADKIFQANEVLRKKFSSDTVGLKQIGDRFIYYKGTKSKTVAISTTADVLIHDEIDRSDLGIIETYKSRISASKYKGVWYLSNPSLISVGVDETWKLSDQKEWFITCSKCGTEQFLKWEDNVDEIRQIYVCNNCGKEITDKERKLGKWKATKQGKEVSGYHISQMMAPWITAKDLIKERELRGDDYFRNFILGEPYSVGEEANIRQAILDGWTAEPLDRKPFFMGIDIGRIKHYVLGSEEGIFKIGTCESREEVESIIDRYNPIVVMDAGPERTWAEEFKKKYPKLFLNFYRRDKDIAELIKWGGMKDNEEDRKNWGFVWTDRTRIIDKTIDEIVRGNIQFALTREDLEQMIRHWESMRRIIEETPQRTERYIWESKTGVDHLCHALVYYVIARNRKAKEFEFLSEQEQKKDIIERTGSGFHMRSLKEIIETGQQDEE